MSVSYKSIKQLIGPLLFIENNHEVKYGEIVEITTANQPNRLGQVVKLSEDMIVVEVFEDTKGMSSDNSEVTFTGSPFKVKISKDMLGGVFNSLGKPIDIYNPNIVLTVDKDYSLTAVFAPDTD